MKRLIITADDFGMSNGVNRAVEQACREGVLTGASLMAGGAAFDDAVAVARRNPELEVGVHLTLVQGRAVLPAEQIPDLVDSAGNFPDNPVAAGVRYFFQRRLYGQLYKEIEAQLCRIREAGITVSHLDGHLNIHMHPTVFAILAELMPRYGIRSFRLAREGLVANLRADAGRLAGKVVETVIFSSLAGAIRPRLDQAGIRYADEVKGLLSSGRLNERCQLALLESVGEGVTELYCHPGVLPDQEISRRMPDYQHQAELAALTGTTLRRRLHELGIALTRYREI